MSIKSQLSGKGGICAIVNNLTGKFYIGKTKDFYKRYYKFLLNIKIITNR